MTEPAAQLTSRVVSDALAERARQEPDRRYVSCGGEWLTFGDLHARAGRVAADLTALGLGRGDRVALIVPNRQEMVELFFACARLGVVQVPLNCFLVGEFLRHQLADSGAETLVADGAGLRSAAGVLAGTAVKRVVTLDDPNGLSTATPVGVETLPYADLRAATGSAADVEQRASDLFAILYTSGTTGPAKGCMIPNGYYWANARANADAGWVVPGDRIFTAFPLFHMAGHHALLSALVNGASVSVEPQFNASTFMARAAEEQATVLLGVGPMGMAVLAQPPSDADTARAFRMAMFTPMHPTHQEAFEARFSTPVIAEGYGQTECSPATISPLHGERRRGTAGRAAAHVEIRIVDDDDVEVPVGQLGEIVLRPREPDVMFAGYWGQPSATLESFRNLWHHTGDSGRIDADGFVTFVDRKTDALRRRGENISSFEVEAAIARHPAVAQAAITAVPGPLGADDIDVKATIVPTPGAEPTPEELFAFFAEHLPYFTVPRYVELRPSLPVSALGRVQKHVLRAEGVTDGTWDFQALGLTMAPEDRRR